MLHRHYHARAGGDEVHRAAHALDHLPLRDPVLAGRAVITTMCSPLTHHLLLTGMIQLARSPLCATSIAPRSVRSTYRARSSISVAAWDRPNPYTYYTCSVLAMYITLLALPPRIIAND